MDAEYVSGDAYRTNRIGSDDSASLLDEHPEPALPLLLLYGIHTRGSDDHLSVRRVVHHTEDIERLPGPRGRELERVRRG